MASQIIQPGTDGNDATIKGSSSTKFGSAGVIASGFYVVAKVSIIYRALLEFNLKDIPWGSIITSATLEAYITGASSGTETFTYRKIIKVYVELNVNWFDANTSDLWTLPGADFIQIPAKQSVGPLSTDTGWITLADNAVGLDEYVQDAMDNESRVLRLIHKRTTEAGANDYIVFHSSDSASADFRPKLTVIYTPPQGNQLAVDANIRQTTTHNVNVQQAVEHLANIKQQVFHNTGIRQATTSDANIKQTIARDVGK